MLEPCTSTAGAGMQTLTIQASKSPGMKNIRVDPNEQQLRDVPERGERTLCTNLIVYEVLLM